LKPGGRGGKESFHYREGRMSRKAPGVDRVVSVLNFVVEHPEQSFTLTQIATALRLSSATCHGLLIGLVEANYLYRTPDKSYMIGPGLLSLAANAQRHFSPLLVARHEMRRLADEFDVVAAAIFREGDELVVRDRAASVSHLGQVIPVGLRIPLRPGRNFFLLQLPEAELDAEFAKMQPPVSPEERQNALRGLAFARQHGFMFGAELGDSDDQSSFVQNGGRIVTQLVPDAEYRLRFLVAPVFNDRGEVEFGITIWGALRQLSGAEVQQMGERLAEASHRVSAFLRARSAPPVQAEGSRKRRPDRRSGTKLASA
jgi:DNA-binding IclR family transcriptional regulator